MDNKRIENSENISKDKGVAIATKKTLASALVFPGVTYGYKSCSIK